MLGQAVCATDLVERLHVGERLYSDGGSQGGRAVVAAQLVARSGVHAFVEVFAAMDAAGSTFAAAATPGVLDLVEHTHGADGMDAARKALEVAGNLGGAALELQGLGIRGLAKKAATTAARETILHELGAGADRAAPAPPPAFVKPVAGFGQRQQHGQVHQR
jgi:hypothetical protein